MPQSSVDTQRLNRLLGGDDLTDLRRRLRRRYTGGDNPPPDLFTLSRLAAHEHAALAGLLGRKRSNAASMRVSHEAIDRALQRAGLAPDLHTALEMLDGPIVDERAQREQSRREWTGVFAAVASHSLSAALGDSAFQGVVKRLAGNETGRGKRLLDQVQQVLAQLPAQGISRSRLAAQTLGDAHGLDQGRPVATILRRAIDPTGELPRMRDMWATQGVLVSELAKPVAVLNLAATGSGSTDLALQIATLAGEPIHLSLRALLQRPPGWQPDQTVFVCENPDVLVAAANELGARCPPMVCLDGQLSAAPRTLLDQLQTCGCRFRYHGDFDWPGLRIANGIFTRYAATPWCYRATDYEPNIGPKLTGAVVAASWDAALAPKMHATGLALHEEAQLRDLLAELANASH